MTKIAEDSKKHTLSVLKGAYLAYESNRIGAKENRENDQISVDKDGKLFLSKKTDHNWFGRTVRRFFGIDLSGLETQSSLAKKLLKWGEKQDFTFRERKNFTTYLSAIVNKRGKKGEFQKKNPRLLEKINEFTSRKPSDKMKKRAERTVEIECNKAKAFTSYVRRGIGFCRKA